MTEEAINKLLESKKEEIKKEEVIDIDSVIDNTLKTSPKYVIPEPTLNLTAPDTDFILKDAKSYMGKLIIGASGILAVEGGVLAVSGAIALIPFIGWIFFIVVLVVLIILDVVILSIFLLGSIIAGIMVAFKYTDVLLYDNLTTYLYRILIASMKSWTYIFTSSNDPGPKKFERKI